MLISMGTNPFFLVSYSFFLLFVIPPPPLASTIECRTHSRWPIHALCMALHCADTISCLGADPWPSAVSLVPLGPWVPRCSGKTISNDLLKLEFASLENLHPPFLLLFFPPSPLVASTTECHTHSRWPIHALCMALHCADTISCLGTDPWPSAVSLVPLGPWVSNFLGKPLQKTLLS